MKRIVIAIVLLCSIGAADAAIMSYSSAVQKAAPSVVNVYFKNTHAIKLGAGTHLKAMGALPQKQNRTRGSGIVMDSKGYILTNYHVVQRMNRIMIALMDGRTIQATLVGSDPETDLAVLHVDLKNLHPIHYANSDNVNVGDVVLAIGNPFGIGQTVTQGIVSAIGRNTIGLNSLENYIQTDAAINPGNSGGALVNTEGALIGINTGIYSRSGSYQGVGFAIPVNNALNVLHQIIKTGTVTRGWLGIEVVTNNTDAMKHINGVVVQSTHKDSPARRVGLKKDDIIVAINSKKISTARGFQNHIAQLKPSTSIKLTVIRNGKTFIADVILAKKPTPPILDDRVFSPDNLGFEHDRLDVFAE